MTRTRQTRIAALEAAHGAHGMDITAVLRGMNDMNRRRASFPTLEAWLAYKKEQQSTWTFAAPLTAALARLRAVRSNEDARPNWVAQHERETWRRERGAYLNAHPEDVQSDLDRELLAERKAT